MTARESLIMFALLRGIERSESNGLAEYLSKEFDFHRHLDKQVKELSGGNKRKLSTSISLIGDPPVLFLDEPTTGKCLSVYKVKLSVKVPMDNYVKCNRCLAVLRMAIK